jgi:hypothetical protein
LRGRLRCGDDSKRSRSNIEEEDDPKPSETTNSILSTRPGPPQGAVPSSLHRNSRMDHAGFAACCRQVIASVRRTKVEFLGLGVAVRSGAAAR